MSKSNERDPCASLKTLVTIQTDFRANDRDGNRVQEYWRKDIAGLYGALDSTGQPIRLVEVTIARADPAPVADYPAIPKPRQPKSGCWYKALRFPGEGEQLDPDRWAACCYPDRYTPGRYTYILSHEGVLYRKDLGPDGSIEAYPADPVKESWEPVK